MTILLASLDSILREALESMHGITVEIESSGPIANQTKVAQQRLYNLTQINADYQTLYIGLSPDNPNGELWIMHKAQLADGLELGK